MQPIGALRGYEVDNYLVWIPSGSGVIPHIGDGRNCFPHQSLQKSHLVGTEYNTDPYYMESLNLGIKKFIINLSYIRAQIPKFALLTYEGKESAFTSKIGHGN